MRELRIGGDGYSWRSRNDSYLWRRLDFLQDQSIAQDYIIHQMFLWQKLRMLGFPAPDLASFHSGFYFVRQPWIKASSGIPTLSQLHKAILQLESAARQGVAHGDLSPEHLLLNGDQVFWIDWIGCSIVGSPGYRGKKEYISPERGISSVVTESSEIYALGTILQGWKRKDSRLELVAKKAAALNPSDRYSSFASLRADLALLLTPWRA